MFTPTCKDAEAAPGNGRGRIFEQHPHEALENCESYKLPDLGGMLVLIGHSRRGRRVPDKDSGPGFAFGFGFVCPRQMAWPSGVAAATTSRGSPVPPININPLPYLFALRDDGPVMWSLMAFAQFWQQF